MTTINSHTIPGSEIKYLPATWRDLNKVRQLENLCFPQDAWPLLDMIATLTMPNIVRFKALRFDRVIGFVAGDVKANQHTGWVATICVHPDMRGKGIGGKLLSMCEQEMGMPRVKLTVRASNSEAINIYLHLGYREVSRWRKYYKGGEDGVVMEKKLGY